MFVRVLGVWWSVVFWMSVVECVANAVWMSR